jgi:hypothetical protein
MRTFLFIVILFIAETVVAQSETELWTRLQVNKKISQKTTLSFDYQHRRSRSGAEKHNLIFSEQMLNSYRLWVNYEIDSSIILVFSPIAYFQNHSLAADVPTTTIKDDVRSMAGILKIIMAGRTATSHRVLYELSLDGVNTSSELIRHRYRMQNSMVLPIKTRGNGTTISYQIFNEVFFRTILGETGFDHNRFYNGIRLKRKHGELNAGYQLNLPKSLPNRHQLLIYLTLNI